MEDGVSLAPDTSTPHLAGTHLVEDVQSRLASWVTTGADQEELANAREETLPLPVMLLHLYRDLARFYERSLGMSQSRVMLLHELMHAGEISQTELAQRLGIETALVTRFVKQMEASGLLGRRTDPQDNRFTLVQLTQAGRQVFEQMMVYSREFEAQLVEGLNEDERAGIKQALKALQDSFLRIKGANNEAIHNSRTHPIASAPQ